ncbi:MAG: outer membrane protein assembly factor BamE [Inquilinus sp.]|nr:outer membrane protein assembly factor BamE [Inquilinus sp.]
MDRNTIGRTLGLIALVAAVAACSPVVATRGNLIDDTRLEQVAVGRSTVNDVASLFGSPSTVSTFDPKVWYYFGQRTEKTAFFDPEIVERRVVLVEFSEYGVVRRIEELGLEDGLPVELVERETPTLGRRLTVLEQLIGNFGRFNNGAQSQR